MRSNSCVEPNNRSVACRPGCAGGGTKKGDLLMCTPKFGLINNSDSMSSVLYRAHVV